MPEQLEIAGIKFGGGLNLVDSPEAMPEGDARILTNWRHYGRGRHTTRRAARTITNTILGEPIGLFSYAHVANTGGVLLTWETGANVVHLYKVDTGGGSATHVGTLAGWASVTVKPRVNAALLNRVLFICDEAKSYGLTCWDPNNVLGSGVGSGLFQPKFIFNGGTAAPIKCRDVAELNNILLVSGYGAETTGDADRPEFLRFSYVGLDPDTGGAGDAGDGATAGSTGLFDTEDAAGVGARGLPIVSMASAAERAVIAASDRAYVLYGSDRDSFQLDELDSARGSVATRGMVSAGDNVYWITTLLDIARYDGGKQLSVISAKIAPRIREMNMTTMFAYHSEEEHQVRWYYAKLSDTNTTPDRWVGWDYIAEELCEDVLGYRVFAAGYVKLSGVETAAGAPTNQAATNITNSTASVNWLNADTSPGVTTEVQIDTVNTFTNPIIKTALSGVATQGFTTLTAATTYYSRERHWRNGAASSWSGTLNFTTLADGVVPTPTDFTATNSPILNTKLHRFDPNVLLAWSLPAPDLKFDVHRSTTTGFTPSAATIIATTNQNAASYNDPSGLVSGTTYYYKIRAIDASGNVSSYTAQVSITPNTRAV